VVARRQYGSTRRGLVSWILQRISAVYLGLYIPWLALRFAIAPAPDFAAWQRWLAGDAVRVGLVLFFAALVVHAWIGMRSVLFDYVKPIGVRFTVSVLVGLVLAASSVWFVNVLYRAGGVA